MPNSRFFHSQFYVSDKICEQIRVFSPDGERIGEFGNYTGPGKLWRPSGVAVDAINKRIIIADKDHHRISFWNMDGDYITSFGKFGHHNGDLNYPWGVAVSPNGELIAVCDSRNHRIQLFNKFGIFLYKFSPIESNPFEYKEVMDYPRGICFDRAGKYIS